MTPNQILAECLGISNGLKHLVRGDLSNIYYSMSYFLISLIFVYTFGRARGVISHFSTEHKMHL